MRPISLCRTDYFGNRRAMTLLEITLVITVLLSLTSVLFLGTVAYKRGTDRTFCIQNISSVQKAVRSYGNMAGLEPGDTVTDLKDEIIGANKLVPMEPICPSNGIYTFGGDILPASSVAYLDCSIETHEPSSTSGW